MSQRGPEWESQRAIESKRDKRDKERASKSQREPQREPVRARGSKSELETTRKSHSEPE